MALLEMEMELFVVLGVVVITIFTILGKVIEEAGNLIISIRKKNKSKSGMVKLCYEICNVHLSLTLGMLGLYWVKIVYLYEIVFLFILFLVGVILKGIFSSCNPDNLKISDKDALYGLYLPNAAGFASVIYVSYNSIG